MNTQDQPCTAEDREKIVAAAQRRVFSLYLLADVLESYGGAKMQIPNGMRDAMNDAARELRQLAE